MMAERLRSLVVLAQNGPGRPKKFRRRLLKKKYLNERSKNSNVKDYYCGHQRNVESCDENYSVTSSILTSLENIRVLVCAQKVQK